MGNALTSILPFVFSIAFSDQYLRQIGWFFAIAAALCVTSTSIHQIFALFNLGAIPLWQTIAPLTIFAGLQSSALSCLFFKNLNELRLFFIPEEITITQDQHKGFDP